MFLLAGLGNPGKQYSQTRHNAGFLVVDELARGTARFHAEYQAQVAKLKIAGRDVLLAKPRTFMNASGLAVASLMRRYRISPDSLLVILDDLDLPLGHLRLRPGGGAGGHHGLESIIHEIGTRDFTRLRLGIGRPDRETVDYVLGAMEPEEKRRFAAALARAAEAARFFISDGPAETMNRFNQPPAEA